MAPSILLEQQSAAHELPSKATVKPTSDDNDLTSGQHPPLYDLLRPFADFPKHITGPTVWEAEDYQHNPERWVHPFSDDEIEELSVAADAFLASGTPLTAISKANFPLPHLAPFLHSIRTELLNGKGFLLFKNFPVARWGNHKAAVAYMGLGTYLGHFVSQNGRGHVLGHVKDVGDDPTQIDKVRIYRTTARQFFHADDADLVGLLCLARALSGGESDLVSAHHVWNVLQRERPDVAELLTQPIWYFDRKGEVSQGQDPYIRTSIFYLETSPGGGDGVRAGGEAATPRVYSKWDPYYIKSLTRFSSAGLIPPLSPAQLEAAQVLEGTCFRLKLHMVLDVGDIQFLSNAHVFHARTAYTDHPPESGRPRRHLMRLWLSTPEGEGGWRLPFADSDRRRRGGVQVDEVAAVAPLDAE